MVKRRVFQPFYEQWAVSLQMKNHNRARNEDSAATRGSSWWVQTVKVIFDFCTLFLLSAAGSGNVETVSVLAQTVL